MYISMSARPLHHSLYANQARVDIIVMARRVISVGQTLPDLVNRDAKNVPACQRNGKDGEYRMY